MNMAIHALVFSLLLTGCAGSKTEAQFDSNQAIETVRAVSFSRFDGSVQGVTTCGESLLVVADGAVWRVSQDGSQNKVLSQAAGVRYAYCLGNDSIMIVESIEPAPWKLFSRVLLNDDTVRHPTKFYLVGDHDFRRVSDEEFLFSSYLYGHWYVNHAGLRGKYLDNELLAHGRFPISCGEHCIFFIGPATTGYEIRTFQNNVETSLVSLPEDTPMGFVRIQGQFVIAYSDFLLWPETGKRIAISAPASQLLSWQNRLVVVTPNELFVTE